MVLPLPKGNFHWEAEVIHNGWFEVLCQEGINTLQAVQIDLQMIL
jgi:hypothetical protein